MAEDKVKFTVEGKGKNLKKTAKEAAKVGEAANRAGEGLDKADKAGGRYHRTQKGVAGATANSTKAFSKMQQGMGGSSGLVGAYATLAANVFAATAAFNALRQAAQMETMIEGLNAVGAAAGRNLPYAAERLREISGAALSAEASIRVMSLGISAGFRTDQMERLTKVARGASLALGRDMTDALDRLTRGTAKLEPEILDELGIMVRLDDATLKYATTLGKSVQDLTQYERRQAFLNETLDQGEKKFGQLAEKIDVNPYDQLSAALNDLAKAGLTVVNDFLGPLINLFVTNQKALIATLILFGTSIFKHMLPGLNSSAQAMANSAKATATDAKMKLQSLKVTQKLPKGYRDAVRAMQEGGLTQAKYQAGLTSLNKSMGQHLGIQARNTQGSAQEVAAYKATTVAIAEVTAAKQRLIVAYQMEQVAQAKKVAANGVELLSQGALITGTKAVGAGIAATSTAYWAAAASGGVFAKSMAVVKIALTGVITVLRGAVAILMGPWGIALAIVGGLIYTFWEDIKEFFGIGTKQIQRNSDEAVEAMKQIGEVGEAFSETLKKAGGMDASVMVAGFTALNGVIQETQSHLKRLGEISRDRLRDNVTGLEVESTKIREQIEHLKKHGNWADKISFKGSPFNWWLGSESKREDLEEYLADIQAQIQRFKDNFEKTLKEDRIRVVETMLEESRTSAAFEKFAQKELNDIEVALAKFSSGVLDAKQFDAEIERIRTPLASVEQAFNGAQDALANFNKETNKLANKTSTPFDKAITAAQVLNNQIEDVKRGIGADGLALDEGQQKVLIDEIKKQTGAESLGELQFGKYVKSLEEAQDRLIKNKDTIKGLQQEQKRLNDIQGKFPKTQQMSIAMSRKQEQIRKTELKGLQDTLFLETELAGAQLKKLETAKDNAVGEEAIRLANKAYDEAKEKAERRSADTNLAILNNIRSRISDEEMILKSRVDQLKMDEAILAAQHAITKAQVKTLELTLRRQRAALELRNLEDPRRVKYTGGAITPQQEFVLAKKQRDVKLEIIVKNTKMMIDEAKLAVTRIKAETELQIFKLNVLKEQRIADGKEVSSINDLIAQFGTLSELQLKAAEMRITAAQAEGRMAAEMLRIEEKRLGVAARRGFSSTATGDTSGARIASGGMALKDLAKGTNAYIKARKRAEVRVNREIEHQRNIHNKTQAASPGFGYFGTPQTMAEARKIYLDEHNKTFEELIESSREVSKAMAASLSEAFNSLPLTEQFGLLRESMQPLIDGFSTLGAEGAAVASGMSQAFIGMGGMMTGLETLKELFGGDDPAFGSLTEMLAGLGDIGNMEIFADSMEGVAGATATAAGAAQALFATQKMGSDVAIARLDREIALEKKRDGQSQASLQKLKKMEADKEKLKKKAFEQDKKAKIAGAVMAGAMAIMQAWAANWIIGLIMTPIIAALTAKQVGIISSMQYNGGGGGAVGGGPGKVSVGSASNKVDVAGSRPGGELAYMRGGRGMGTGASDFTRHGFVGAKYRAVGGAAYVVGEQGPEVIVPEAPGRIIPNDELAAGGAPINATFNINTIDATNMEQTLISQRGNIIGMIRDAANNQGQTFLEGLDTMALGDD